MSDFKKWIFVGAFAGLSASSGQAETLHHETDYRVALSGIPIARADFKTEVEENHYKIKGLISSSGLVDLVKTISAEAVVNGVVGPRKLEASRYTLYYKSGHKEHTYDVVYRDGNVTSTTTTPQPQRPDNWIPVKEGDLRSVLDPISGLIFSANTDVCAQNLPIYDGETRMNLKLSPKGTKPFSTEGFKGDAIVCSVHFKALGGYKQSRTDFDYLAKSDDMEIWFAKADGMKVYAPVYVAIPTKYGTVTITAVKYGS